MCSERLSLGMDRREFLKLGGAGLTGAVLLGTVGGRVLAQTGPSLKAEFEAAGAEYGVPRELLLAMGYVNTLWEMPSPEGSEFESGDIHGRGAYGIMQLQQNPWSDTLDRAAGLTGLSEEQLKNDRAANIRGGAAVLADIQGPNRPDGPNGWQGAVTEYGDIELYTAEVYDTLREGASLTISTGERVTLAPQGGVEVPQGGVEVPQEAVTAQRRRGTDYPRAVWRPAARHNYTPSRRERGRKLDINKIIIHIVDGSYSSAINWFQNEASNVSAHYVVSRGGHITQMVRHKDIAWHAGHWPYNRQSIGIEHEGFDESPNNWTPQMVRASARLAAFVAKRHRIPVNSRHIVLHRNVPGVTKPCPGYYFRYRTYLRLVRRFKR